MTCFVIKNHGNAVSQFDAVNSSAETEAFIVNSDITFESGNHYLLRLNDGMLIVFNKCSELMMNLFLQKICRAYDIITICFIKTSVDDVPEAAERQLFFCQRNADHRGKVFFEYRVDKFSNVSRIDIVGNIDTLTQSKYVPIVKL